MLLCLKENIFEFLYRNYVTTILLGFDLLIYLFFVNLAVIQHRPFLQSNILLNGEGNKAKLIYILYLIKEEKAYEKK